MLRICAFVPSSRTFTRYEWLTASAAISFSSTMPFSWRPSIAFTDTITVSPFPILAMSDSGTLIFTHR